MNPPVPNAASPAQDGEGDDTAGDMQFSSRRQQASRRSMSSFERARLSITSPGTSFRTNAAAREDEEDELRKAAIEAYKRWRSDGGTNRSAKPHRKALIRAEGEEGSSGKLKEIDVKKMTVDEHKKVAQGAMSTKDPDVQPFLKRLHERMDRVGITHSTVEVRWENLAVETDVFVGSRALPTVTNAFLDYAQMPFNAVGVKFSGKRRFPILQQMSGVLKPGRFTLLLGPPGSGKSTLLKTLAGGVRAGTLRVAGEVTYNGHKLDEFVCQRTSSYIGQRDIHIAELSVRETLDFSARCQGVGHKSQELQTLMEREAEQGIDPDPEMDAFMKAEAQAGGRYSVVTEFIMRLLGLDHVADTHIGNEMIRGVSGGQRKRVTTGEMVVGPKKTLFMDEISTGLDSSTTFQITQILANFAHLRDATILLALLQPAPEVFELFDDILLLSEGSIVFHGPREDVLPFFESMGFKLPERKGIADFLQEVTSPKDQAQYWADPSKPYSFVPVTAFAEAFQQTQAAQRTRNVLEMPYDRAASPEGALGKGKYGLPRQKLLRATLRREITLIQRNAFVYGFRTFQIIVTSLMLSTLFFRTTRHPNSIDEANFYAGILFFSLISMLFNNWAEFSLIVDRLPVFYKQRDNRFYPAWAFALPTMVLSIPQAVLESGIWSVIVYWVAGLQISAGGFFTFFLFMFLMHQFAVALFRLVGAAAKTPGLANAASSVVALLILINGGFLLPRTSIRWWWRWFFYIDPMAWVQRSIALNEFRAPRWDKPSPVPGESIGTLILQERGWENSLAWLWGGVPFMIGAIIVMDIAIILCLAYLKNPADKPGGMVPEEEVEGKQAAAEGRVAEMSDISTAKPGAALAKGSSGSSHVAVDVDHAHSDDTALSSHDSGKRQSSSSEAGPEDEGEEGGRAAASAAKLNVGTSTEKSTLPFDQLWLSFHHVWYSVDLPSGMDAPVDHPKNAESGQKPRLYLLNDVSGAFRPNVLTALIGETGAGKTTLMDVLAGRKTGGLIEGDIRVQGHPKVQQTFSRVSGYCEQNDIHSPNTTVREALLFSASLRLTADNLDKKTLNDFVDEVMDIVELTPLRGALVGLPGASGLSVEQRKRLTIAVELVANPSIVFMDEPTSGLDARAAAIVMRAVRNTVDTGRTVVCTIHQPSIDIFESFDELLLMKRGGRIIFHGPLGRQSCKLIEYFQGIEGVPEIRDGYNPATWALDVTNGASERRLERDFADVYEASALHKRTDALVEELSVPPEDSEPLHFESRYPRNWMQQFRTCLWKNNAVYWRSPEYNSVRFMFTILLAFIFGTSFWAVGKNRSNENSVIAISGALFAATMFLGVYNSSSVQPVVSTERSVFYRERSAGMYAALPYAFAQVVIEIPYILVQSVTFTVLIYAMIQFRWEPAPFFWFLFFETLSLTLFTMYGIASVALTPNVVVASIISGTTYYTMALFSGFVLQTPSTPGWWIWAYYIDPVFWIIYGTVASQLGDIHNQSITLIDGQVQTVAEFITYHFGFHYDLLGVCVAVLCAEILILFFGVAWSYSKLTWEKR